MVETIIFDVMLNQLHDCLIFGVDDCGILPGTLALSAVSEPQDIYTQHAIKYLSTNGHVTHVCPGHEVRVGRYSCHDLRKDDPVGENVCLFTVALASQQLWCHPVW